MFAELVEIVEQVMFESVSSKEKLLHLLPSSLDDKLKGLIVGVIASNLAKWRKQTSNSQLSLPKLKEFDWRIDIKSASDTSARLSMPTAIVQMKVRRRPVIPNCLNDNACPTFFLHDDALYPGPSPMPRRGLTAGLLTPSPDAVQVENFPKSKTDVAQTDEIAFEVNRDTLDTVLDGLGKIRDQLASVAG